MINRLRLILCEPDFDMKKFEKFEFNILLVKAENDVIDTKHIEQIALLTQAQHIIIERTTHFNIYKNKVALNKICEFIRAS